jgi:hypothetical protein
MYWPSSAANVIGPSIASYNAVSFCEVGPAWRAWGWANCQLGSSFFFALTPHGREGPPIGKEGDITYPQIKLAAKSGSITFALLPPSPPHLLIFLPFLPAVAGGTNKRTSQRTRDPPPPTPRPLLGAASSSTGAAVRPPVARRSRRRPSDPRHA